jgi:hypothetical protein
MAKPKKLPPELQAWIDARQKFRLSHAHVQMARELGMNPKKLGGLANHKQELWKRPLPQYIEELYFKRFKKERPDSVRPIEQIAADKKQKQADRRELKRQPRDNSHAENDVPPPAQSDRRSPRIEDDWIPF